MTNKELNVINSVIANKDIGALFAQSVDEMFVAYADVWDYIKNYYAKYHSVPSVEIVQERFSDFEHTEVKDATSFHIDSLKEEYLNSRLDQIVTKAAMAQKNGMAPGEIINNVNASLTKLARVSSNAKDLNIMDFEDSIRHYEGVKQRALSMGGSPGIPTGVDFIDSAYPSGFSGGDLIVVLGWAQPHSEPILTPIGWKTMRDIKVGDEVVGSNGQPTLVTETHERGTREVFTVNFSDGTFVNCDKDHLWTVQTSKSRQIGGDTKTVSTQEMLDGGVLFNRQERKSFKYYLPLPEPVTGTKLNTVVGPYLMGQLLSDGCTVGDSIFLTTNDKQAISIARQENPHIDIQERTTDTSTARQWIVLGGYKKLKIEKGCYAHQKSIPDEYMTATPEERLSLLRGLMDGDGHCGGRRKSVFTSTSVRLAEDVAMLVRSLGGVAKVHNDKRKYKNGECSNVSIWLPDNPFGISRKADKYAPVLNGFKAIESIVTTNQQEPMKCIKVDAKDSLYVTRNYTLTHNTGRGKSMFTTLVSANAFDRGHDPAIFSLEMSGEKVRDRIYTIMGKGRFRNSDFMMGDVNFDDFNTFKSKFEEGRNFNIISTGGVDNLTPNYVQAKINQHNPKMVTIDYAQLATDNSNSTDMTARMRNMSTEYKSLAVRNDIPVVLISSATADSGTAANTPPTIEQVAWSRQLAFDADLAFAVHKHDDSNMIEIACRKNRNGPLFSGYLNWDIDSGIIVEEYDL